MVYSIYRPTSASRALVLLVTGLAATTTLPSVRGQEAPLYNATTIVASNDNGTTVRTNFCDRHRKVERGELRLRHALKGLNLRPGIFRYQLDDDSRIDEVDPPMGIKILDEIARRAQFRWRNSYGVLESPVGNETWDDVLLQTIDSYDLMGDWYLRTTDRLANGILFPEKWYDGSLIMVRKRAELDGSFNWTAFLDPFRTEVWWLILGTTMVSGVLYYVLDYIACDGNKRKMEEATLGWSVLNNFINMTGQYMLNPNHLGNFIVAFSTCLVFLIILATYTANLASFMVIRNTPDVIINEIQDVIKNDLSLCLMKGTAGETFMLERYSGARLVEKTEIIDSYLGLDVGDCDVALTTIDTWQSKKFDIEYNEDCRKEWVGRVVQKMDAGYTLGDSAELCSSLVRDVLSLHLLEMKRDKTFQTIWDTERAESVTNNCADLFAGQSDKLLEDVIRMSVKNMGGIFIVHGGFLVLGAIVTVLAKFRRNLGRKRPGPNAGAGAGAAASSSSSAAATNRSDPPTDKTTPENQDDDEGVHDLECSEEGSKSSNSTSTKAMDYLAAMRKQTECMESMKQQMEAMQQQLAKLTEQQQQVQLKTAPGGGHETGTAPAPAPADDTPSQPNRVQRRPRDAYSAAFEDVANNENNPSYLSGSLLVETASFE